MVAVDATTALKYGFRLLGYLVAVIIAGGILMMIGAASAPTGFNRGGNIVLAFVFYLAGLAVIWAGSLGLLYKVIADGVAVGNRSAEQPAQPQGGYPGGGRPAQGGQPAQSDQRTQGGEPSQGGQPTQGQQR